MIKIDWETKEPTYVTKRCDECVTLAGTCKRDIRSGNCENKYETTCSTKEFLDKITKQVYKFPKEIFDARDINRVKSIFRMWTIRNTFEIFLSQELKIDLIPGTYDNMLDEYSTRKHDRKANTGMCISSINWNSKSTNVKLECSECITANNERCTLNHGTDFCEKRDSKCSTKGFKAVIQYKINMFPMDL